MRFQPDTTASAGGPFRGTCKEPPQPCHCSREQKVQEAATVVAGICPCHDEWCCCQLILHLHEFLNSLLKRQCMALC